MPALSSRIPSKGRNPDAMKFLKQGPTDFRLSSLPTSLSIINDLLSSLGSIKEYSGHGGLVHFCNVPDAMQQEQSHILHLLDFALEDRERII